VQLDCIGDKSHREQLTFIIRVGEISNKAEVQINEYFIAFIHIISNTGSSLTEELKAQLAAFEINLSDCRGQAYDNGANMVGRHQGVQSRILSENPRAFFIPCSTHTLHLLLGDMSSSVPLAMSFFLAQLNVFTQFLQHLPKDGKFLPPISQILL
jgi:hypothetical protein